MEFPAAAVERAMTYQQVILRALAGTWTWLKAADVLGFDPARIADVATLTGPRPGRGRDRPRVRERRGGSDARDRRSRADRARPATRVRVTDAGSRPASAALPGRRFAGAGRSV